MFSYLSRGNIEIIKKLYQNFNLMKFYKFKSSLLIYNFLNLEIFIDGLGGNNFFPDVFFISLFEALTKL
jgi:hypothetical protein